MTRILITSGPTREYLDPVRYLSNASSGRMGCALAAAAIAAGHQVAVVSGPVEIDYPAGVEVTRVVSTQQMLEACLKLFPHCGGLIAAAAPCDYRAAEVSVQKLAKTGRRLLIELAETVDIVATLAAQKTSQWIVAFALETEDGRARAMQKLKQKRCELIVLNGPEAMQAADTTAEVLDSDGHVLASLAGSKQHVAAAIFRIIQRRLIEPL